MHPSSWPWPRLSALDIPCYVFQWLYFWERGWVVLCFRHGLCDDVLRPIPCSSVCGLHCTGPTTARHPQWETVISCAGGQVFLVHLGGALSVMQAVPVAAGCSMKEGSSFSVSFWLRMRGHGGAGSRSRNSLFCVPWARCARAVAPYLVCEELAVILVDGCGCGACAHPCEAAASGLLSLGSPHPSTGSVWWLSGIRVEPVLLAWTYHCF